MEGDPKRRVTRPLRKSRTSFVSKRTSSGARNVEAQPRRRRFVARGSTRFSPGVALPSPQSLAAGDVVGGRYRIVRRIGAGGMGEVFEATHGRLNTVVGIKTIQPQFLDRDGLRKAFYREARFAASIRHPNTVSVIDYDEDPNVGPFLVMELEEGRILEGVLRDRGPMPEVEAVELVCNALDALQFVHDQGLIHGDIKPANLMLCVDLGSGEGTQRLKLLDFGLSRSAAHKHDGNVTGTPEYLAPEVIAGRAMSVRSDLYAVGILLYELVTGSTPFSGPVNDVLNQHLHADVPSISALAPLVADSVQRALSKDFSRRPQSAAEMAHELRAAVSGYSGPRDTESRDNPGAACVGRAVIDTTGRLVYTNETFADLCQARGPAVQQHIDELGFVEAWPTHAADRVAASRARKVVRRIRAHDNNEYVLLLEPLADTTLIQLTLVRAGD